MSKRRLFSRFDRIIISSPAFAFEPKDFVGTFEPHARAVAPSIRCIVDVLSRPTRTLRRLPQFGTITCPQQINMARRSLHHVLSSRGLFRVTPSMLSSPLPTSSVTDSMIACCLPPASSSEEVENRRDIAATKRPIARHARLSHPR